MIYHRFGKRLLDIVIAAAAMILLSPVFAVIALTIFLLDGPPVLFRQQRAGRDGRSFEFLKFRSMAVGSPNVVSSEAGMLRVTGFGRIIRRTNLDELPQLWNIFRGDMSLVGPRPALPSQHDLIELRRKNGSIRCRPGLTGWAQVNAFDHMPVAVKADFDSEYAKSISFACDVRIIARTFRYLCNPPPTY